MASDGADDRLVNLEGDAEGKYTSAHIELEPTPEPLDDLLSTLPAPADDIYPPGLNVENEEEEEATGRGGGRHMHSRANGTLPLSGH